MLGPVVLGDGIPAFAAVAVPPLQLIGTQSFEGSANLVVKYAPAKLAAGRAGKA